MLLNLNSSLTGIAFEQKDYFELVDWTGKQVRDDKPGSIPVAIGSLVILFLYRQHAIPGVSKN